MAGIIEILVIKRGGREEHPGFYEKESSGEIIEFGEFVEVDSSLAVEALKVLFGYGGDMDIIDIHIVALDQVEEEIQRAFKILEVEGSPARSTLGRDGRGGVKGCLDVWIAIHHG
jgi:hypothetical protein